MRAAVVIDYPDVRSNARRAFAVTDVNDAHIDPVRCAELLVARSHAGVVLELTAIHVHHAIPDRHHNPGDARLERVRIRGWRAVDERVVVRRRGLRVPGHDPGAPGQDKGVAVAVAIDASLLATSPKAEHVIVFTHRPDFIVLAELARERRLPPGLEFASWQSAAFRIKVPVTERIPNITLYREDFEQCRNSWDPGAFNQVAARP
jgi:hypothetical protein